MVTFTLVHLKMAKDMVRVKLLNLMGINILDSGKMTKNKVMVPKFLIMVIFIKVNF